MSRYLVLFAREPVLQAREKGLDSREAGGLFREFAAGWIKAADDAGAGLIVATPPEDLPRWRRVLPAAENIGWIRQRGATLGERLEDAARRAAALGGRAVLVGGDVAPSASVLKAAFEALENGADAAVSPALDGGVSLLGLSVADLDLLRGLRRRRRTVLRDLLGALALRGRRVELIAPAADVDGPRSLRALLRHMPAQAPLRSLVRALLSPQPGMDCFPLLPPRDSSLAAPSGLRAPPA